VVARQFGHPRRSAKYPAAALDVMCITSSDSLQIKSAE
jgi:hypothetical protein